MATVGIGIFSVTILAIPIASGTTTRTSPLTVYAGTNNITLALAIADAIGIPVSGSFTIQVKAGDWFNALVAFTSGAATITFGVTTAGEYSNIPVEVVFV